MKTLSNRGGNFLRKWQGSPPKGRDSSPLQYQKGQAEQSRLERYEKIYQPGQGWVKVWRF